MKLKCREGRHIPKVVLVLINQLITTKEFEITLALLSEISKNLPTDLTVEIYDPPIVVKIAQLKGVHAQIVAFVTILPSFVGNRKEIESQNQELILTKISNPRLQQWEHRRRSMIRFIK